MQTYVDGSIVWMQVSLSVTTGAFAMRLRHTHASKPNTTQFKQLTPYVAITSSLPPISHTYFTTSRCPFQQAIMRQVRPSCKCWPSDHHHTLSPQPWQGSLQLLSHSYHTRARASAGPHAPQSLTVRAWNVHQKRPSAHVRDAGSCLLHAMYACIRVGVEVCMHVFICLHAWVHAYVFVNIHIYTCIHVYVFMHICIYIYVHTYIHTHIYTHTWIYIYIHTHTHIYECMYT